MAVPGGEVPSRGEARVRMLITVQLFGEENVIWGYVHDELVGVNVDSTAEEEFLKIGQRVLDRVDEAKASIGEQIRAAGVRPGDPE